MEHARLCMADSDWNISVSVFVALAGVCDSGEFTRSHVPKHSIHFGLDQHLDRWSVCHRHCIHEYLAYFNEAVFGCRILLSDIQFACDGIQCLLLL